jgi:hypothetical protein
MGKKYQITEYVDWFYFGEVMKILSKMKPGEKLEIVKLEDSP